MALATDDLTLYGSQNMADDGTTTAIGGAIDLTTIVSFTPLGSNGTIEVLSDNPADTMNITVTGRNSAGVDFSETVALTGTTVKAFPSNFERILISDLASAAAGTILVRKTGNAGDLISFPPGVTTVRRPLIKIGAAETGGAERKFYEKVFYKNENATSALLNAIVEYGVNPGNQYALALAASQNDTGTNGVGNNHEVKPAALTFDGTPKTVPGAHILPGEQIGIWIERTLAAGAAAGENTFNLKVKGQGA